MITRMNNSLMKMSLATAALAGLMLFTGTPRAFADDCQKRIVKADRNLHRAAERHGWESPEAEHWRHELREARAYCWEHSHRWWDEDGRRWREERDWDDHDHDHDRH